MASIELIFLLFPGRRSLRFEKPYDDLEADAGGPEGEEPNETFQDVVPIIFTLDFLQR